MTRPDDDGSLYLACPHPDGVTAALAVRREGGNAVDAAVAAAAALSVCYPHMTGLGGDLFALVKTPSDGVWVINGSGTAPAGTDPDVLRRRYGGEMPRWGAATVTVPGAVHAWCDLLRRFGNTSLPLALGHAIRLAGDGIRVSKHLAEALREDAGRLMRDPAIRGIFYPAGRVPLAGDWLVQPQLASALGEIAAHGADSAYQGDIADALVTFLNEQGSQIARRDLSLHRSTWCRPASRRYHEWVLCTAPPNSQGMTLLSIMAEIERRGLVPDHLGPDAAVIAGIFRRAMRARDGTLTDPDAAAGPRRPTADTVGIVAADSDGWWISLNQSLFDSFGAGIAEPRTGIVLHNRGAGFSLATGRPDTLRPGVRPPHTLMPTLVMRGDSAVAALATMGGSAHPQIHAEVLMSLLAAGNAGDAVRRPRWLAGGTSGEDYSVCVAEPEIPRHVRAGLGAGFRLIAEPTTANGVGHAQLVARLTDRTCVAAADPRSDGAAYPRGAS